MSPRRARSVPFQSYDIETYLRRWTLASSDISPLDNAKAVAAQYALDYRRVRVVVHSQSLRRPIVMQWKDGKSRTMLLTEGRTRTYLYQEEDVTVQVDVLQGQAKYTCVGCRLNDGRNDTFGVASHTIEHLNLHKRAHDIIPSTLFNTIRTMAVEEQGSDVW